MAQEISIFSIFSEIKLRESFLLFDDLMAQRFNKPLLTTSQRAELKASIDELREKKNVFQAYYNQHREFIAKQALIEVLTDPALKQFNSVTSGIKREYNGFTIYFNVEYFENRKRSVPSRDYDITTMVKHESRLSFFLFDETLELFTPEYTRSEEDRVVGLVNSLGHNDYGIYASKYPEYFYIYPHRYLIWGEPPLEESFLKIYDLFNLGKLVYTITKILVKKIPALTVKQLKTADRVLKQIKLPSLQSLFGLKPAIKPTGKGTLKTLPDDPRAIANRGLLERVNPEIDRMVERELVDSGLTYGGPLSKPKPARAPTSGLAEAARRKFKSLQMRFSSQLGVRKGGQVHHAIELQVLDKYPGVYTEAELNSLRNMRGIQPENAGKLQLHNSAIRSKIDDTYRYLDAQILRRGLMPGTPEYNILVKESLDETVRYMDWAYGNFDDAFLRVRSILQLP